MTYSDFSASNFLASARSCFASSKASSKSTEFKISFNSKIYSNVKVTPFVICE